MLLAKQMNVAHGPQQINNGTEGTRTENVFELNKQSDQESAHHELREDTEALRRRDCKYIAARA